MMGIIHRTFDHMDEQCFTTIFKYLVCPHIEYTNQIWTPPLLKHITALENLQHRPIKLIPGFKDLDYKEHLQRLKLPTLVYCRLGGDIIELYKILTGKYEASVSSSLVTLRDNDSDTRHNLKIYTQKMQFKHQKIFEAQMYGTTSHNLWWRLYLSNLLRENRQIVAKPSHQIRLYCPHPILEIVRCMCKIRPDNSNK